MRRLAALTLGLALAGSAGGALADPGKDESGKGRRGYERSFERDGDRGRGYGRYREAVRIPRGHLPPPGECRTWYPGRPAGHQPPPYRC